jgi:MFS family permease
VSTSTRVPDISAGSEWRRSWTVVAASVVGLILLTVNVYSTGVMVVPLEREFGWSRAEIFSGPMIVSCVGVLVAPFLGMAIDRFGARRIAIVGATLYCFAIGLLSTATGNIWSWWALWSVVALTTAFISPTVWMAAVSSLFSASRGLALAVTLCGTGLGAGLIPIASNIFLNQFGWRQAYIALAVFWGLITLPLLVFLFSSATDRQRGTVAVETAAKRAALSGLSKREGFLSWVFVKLLVAASAICLVISGLIVNLVPILRWQGIASSTAAAVAGIVGVGTVVGRLCTGVLLDRLDARIVAAVGVAAPIATSLLLIGAPGSIPVAMAAVAIVGLAAGAELNAVAYLASKYFGLRNFGALFGTISGFLVLTNGLGPLVLNSVYDVTHSYAVGLWLVIPFSLLSSILFVTLKRYEKVVVAGPVAAATTGLDRLR